MKLVAYAGTELLTGDEIAHALLRYGEALARAGDAGTVEVPILEPDGGRSMATILVGPASQIIARDVDIECVELVDRIVVDELNARTRRLRVVARADVEAPVETGWQEEY